MTKCLVCIDVYTVKAGDTLYSIAEAYDIPVGLLMRVNHICNPYNLRIGTKLCIPGDPSQLPASPGRGTQPNPAPEVPSPMPSPAPNPMPSPMPTPTPNPAPERPSAPCRGIMHTIAPGDTLYLIAKQHHADLNSIIEANPGIDPYDLRIGTRICIPQ